MRLKVDLSQTRPQCCTKCGKRKSLFRHHMGNDGQLGSSNKWIAENYCKYLDCVPLCNRCHMIIHFIYVPLVQVWVDFSSNGVLRLRKHLIVICKMWLDGKIKNPAVSKEFKVTWQRNFQEWRENQRAKKLSTPRTSEK